MKPAIRRILVTIAIALPVLAAGGWYLLHQPGFVRQQLERLVTAATGWQLQLDDDLRLEWGRTSRIEARQLQLSNPRWPQDPVLFTATRLRLEFRPLELLHGRLDLRLLDLGNCQLYLDRNEAGDSNWALARKTAEAEPPPGAGDGFHWNLSQLLVQDCTVQSRSSGQEQPLEIRLDQALLGVDEQQLLEISATGAIDRQDLSVTGNLQPLPALWQGGALRHSLDIQAGHIVLRSEGSVEDLYTGDGADLNLRFTGPEFARITEWLALPPFSSGEFDARVALRRLPGEGATEIGIDADLGSLEITGEGRLDRFRAPDRGNLVLQVRGPDLQALGQVLGWPGLLPGPFEADLDADFAQGSARLESASISTGSDRLRASGRLGSWPGLAGTELEIVAQTPDLSAWLPGESGASRFFGSLDSRIRFSRDEQQRDTLQAEGRLGRRGVSGTRDYSVLAKAQRQDEVLRLDQLKLEVGADRLDASGSVKLRPAFEGSELKLELQVADLASSGQWLAPGASGLPHRPLQLQASLRRPGPGVEFSLAADKANGQVIHLTGNMPDLDRWLAINAQFDIELPSLKLAQFLVPDTPLPDLPFSARGELQNDGQRHETRVRNAEVKLGEINVRLQARLQLQDQLAGSTGGRNMQISLGVEGDDASRLNPWLGPLFDSQPFALQARVDTEPGHIRIRDLALRQGQSELFATVDVGLAERPVIQARVKSPLLDLSPLRQHAVAGLAEPAPQRKLLFRDEPIQVVGELPVDLSLDLDIEQLLLDDHRIRQLQAAADWTQHALEVKDFAFSGDQDGHYKGHLSAQQQAGITGFSLFMLADDLKLGLIGTSGQDPATLPASDILVDLAGKGSTWHELAQTLRGRVRWYAGSGRISNTGLDFLFADLVTQIFTTLNPLSKSSRYTTLDCAVYAADFTDGMVSMAPIVIRTDGITAFSSGQLDLSNEVIVLNFNTVPRKGLGISAGSVVNPFFRIGGTLMKPAVELDVTKGAISGGVMVATAGLSVLFKSLSDRLLASKDPCGDARSSIELGDSQQGKQ